MGVSTCCATRHTGWLARGHIGAWMLERAREHRAGLQGGSGAGYDNQTIHYTNGSGRGNGSCGIDGKRGNGIADDEVAFERAQQTGLYEWFWELEDDDE